MSSLALRLISRSVNQQCNLMRSGNIKVACLPSNHHIIRSLQAYAPLLQVRKSNTNKSSSDIDVQRDRPYEHLTAGQKVAQAGQDLTYLLVIVAGVGIAGILFYAVGSELFSSSGPNAVYSAAFKKCINDIKVLDALGQPVKAHGETNRRGRRRHVQHTEFITNKGEEHTRIRFYLTGAFRTAIVHAEMFKNEKGKQEFEYLVVELEGYPPKSIELERRVQHTPELPKLYH